jgi:hypothetical protein
MVVSAKNHIWYLLPGGRKICGNPVARMARLLEPPIQVQVRISIRAVSYLSRSSRVEIFQLILQKLVRTLRSFPIPYRK